MNYVTKKTKLIAVVGPTASGKTAVAVRLAQRLGGEIVSCDSMQIYRHMPIAAAVPTLDERQGIPHHLLEIVEPGEEFSVAKYCALAHEIIADITARGKTPILCGGTGLYFSSVVDDLSFLEESFDTKLRRELEERIEREGGEAMLRALREVDPETAGRLSPTDRKRIVRAFEVYLTTGTPISEQARLSRAGGSRYDLFAIGLTFAERWKLYHRINDRVDAMLDAGLVDEARTSLASPGRTAAQAIGHKELADYINGLCSLEEAAEKLKMATRRYAKRQLTWFRRDGRINWICMDGLTADDAADMAIKMLTEGKNHD